MGEKGQDHSPLHLDNTKGYLKGRGAGGEAWSPLALRTSIWAKLLALRLAEAPTSKGPVDPGLMYEYSRIQAEGDLRVFTSHSLYKRASDIKVTFGI